MFRIPNPIPAADDTPHTIPIHARASLTLAICLALGSSSSNRLAAQSRADDYSGALTQTYGAHPGKTNHYIKQPTATTATAYRNFEKTNNGKHKLARAYSQGKWTWISYNGDGSYKHCGYAQSEKWGAWYGDDRESSKKKGDDGPSGERSCTPPGTGGCDCECVSSSSTEVVNSGNSTKIKVSAGAVFLGRAALSGPGERQLANFTLKVVDASTNGVVFDGTVQLTQQYGQPVRLELLGGMATLPLQLLSVPNGTAVDLSPIDLTFASLPLQDARTSSSGAAIGPEGFDGGHEQYGSGCEGSSAAPAPAVIAPSSYARAFGNVDMPIGVASRAQQIFDSGMLPSTPFMATGLAYRFGNRARARGSDPWIDVQYDLGMSQHDPRSLTTSFGGNFASTPTRVLPLTRVNLPLVSDPNVDPGRFDVQIPFAVPYTYLPSAGRTLLIEVVHTDHQGGAAVPLDYSFDGVLDTTAMPASILYAPNPTAATGTINAGAGAILGFLPLVSRAPAPVVLSAAGAANPGGIYYLNMSQARASSFGVATLGLSRTMWNQNALPFDLAMFGAPGCSLLASIDATVAIAIGASGTGSLALNIPNVPALVGAELYQQGMVVDPGANALGLAVTNGVRSTIGGWR